MTHFWVISRPLFWTPPYMTPQRNNDQIDDSCPKGSQNPTPKMGPKWTTPIFKSLTGFGRFDH